MNLPKRDGVNGRYYLIHKPDTEPEVLKHADQCIQDVLDILPGLILTLFFPYQSGIACYCCQRCAQFMGDSMYRLLP